MARGGNWCRRGVRKNTNCIIVPKETDETGEGSDRFSFNEKGKKKKSSGGEDFKKNYRGLKREKKGKGNKGA